MNELEIQFILLFLKNKKIISSSYLLNQIFTRFGVFSSVENALLNLEQKKLIATGGFFEGTSGLIKNIKITEEGISYINSFEENNLISKMEAEFSNFEPFKKILLNQNESN